MELKVLILGSTGFIGSYLVDYFQDKYTVFAPSRSLVNLLDANQVGHMMGSIRPDVVIYAAHIGKFGQYTPDSVEKNIRMLVNIASTRDYFDKLIYLSSGAEYDKSKDLKLVTEDMIGENVPTDQYGFSKAIVSHWITAMNKSLVLRPFGVYGEGEGLSRFPSRVIYNAIHNEEIRIKQDLVMDYIYIEDLARVINHFIIKDSTKDSFNVTGDKPIKLTDIARMAKQIANSKSKIIVEDDRKGFDYTGDITLLKKELGDFKFTSMREGLMRLYNFYSNKGEMN